MSTDPAAEANRLYWETEVSVSEIAERLDLSRRALYEALQPRLTGDGCDHCGGPLVWENRSARTEDERQCAMCGATPEAHAHTPEDDDDVASDDDVNSDYDVDPDYDDFDPDYDDFDHDDDVADERLLSVHREVAPAGIPAAYRDDDAHEEGPALNLRQSGAMLAGAAAGLALTLLLVPRR